MQRSTIAPNLFQEVLDSASNAGAKGQAQYFTPHQVGDYLARFLPDHRPVIVDLSCGRGDLLHAVANRSTEHLLGIDIDPMRFASRKQLKIPDLPVDADKITGDLTRLYPLLWESGFKADLFALNPPWDLHFHREHLAHLAESDLIAVREALAAHDGRTRRDTIDSTVATLLIALDLSTDYGEGLILANTSTVERLILNPGAPHASLARHLWAHTRFPLHLFTGNTDSPAAERTVSALFFARDHHDGLPSETPSGNPDRRDRQGAEIYSGYNCSKETHRTFQAVAEEWRQQQCAAGKARTDFNLWLTAAGTVATHLSLYDNAILDRKPFELQVEARELHKLNGKSPMALVLQRAERDHLQRAASSTTWRVDPQLQDAVRKAIASYHDQRAPLYPLNPIQRLAYLDEQDTILCLKDFTEGPSDLSATSDHTPTTPSLQHPISPSPCHPVIFKAGHSYTISTETIEVTRQSKAPNLAGLDELLELTGQELLIFIHDEDGVKRTFVDPRVKQHKATGEHAAAIAGAFPLQRLLDHFQIPDVPDVSASNPTLYAQLADQLAQLEALFINPLAKCKQFQRDDLTRGAMHDGLCKGWDTGLGKSRAAILWPLLKLGWTVRASADSRQKTPSPPSDGGEGRGEVAFEILPKEPVLIIAPGDLHAQFIEEIRDLFNIHILRLDSQATFHRLATNGHLPPAFYLSSYTEVAINGTRKAGADSANDVPSTPLHHSTTPVPLSDLIRTAFACIVIDEGVRIKGAQSIIGCRVRSLKARCRLVLTGTPIKNRLQDIYWLLWWAAGAHDDATARWPYTSDPEEQTRFAETFLISERNLTREAQAKKANENRRFKKRTAQVCNIHRLWKLFAPIVLRRRKDNIGSDIVPKVFHRIRVPMGLEQKAVYEYHLKSQPKDKEGRPAIGAKLNSLRFAAGAPASAHLHQVADEKTVGTWRSRYSYTPKIASALTLIQQLISQGQQVLVGSAIIDPLDILSERLTEACVPHLNLDGRASPGKRGKLAAQFKAGKAGGIPVALCGLESMAEGHNFFRCSHAVILCYSWAMDKVEQFINRIHRLNSPFPVHVWCFICDGTIDRKQESMLNEKTDGADLALDGILLDREYKDVSLAEMLACAAEDFDATSQTIDETILLAEWPALRAKLLDAFTTWKSSIPAGSEISNLESQISIIPSLHHSTTPATNTILERARQLLAA